LSTSEVPKAHNISCEMNQGDEISLHLEGSTSTDRKITYEITKAPRNGAYALDPQTGHLQYRPTITYTGLDSMTYIVQDESGLESEPADVVIDIKAGEVEDTVEIVIEVPVPVTAQDVVAAVQEFMKQLDKLTD